MKLASPLLSSSASTVMLDKSNPFIHQTGNCPTNNQPIHEHKYHKFEEKRQHEIEKILIQKEEQIARLQWTREQIEAEQLSRLRSTLAFAKEHSPFYAKRLAHICPDTFELKDLSKIPPTTKTDVMENWNDIVTDPDLTLEAANDFLADLRHGRSDNYYFQDKYYLSATGGSSGNRGLFVWDPEFFQVTSAITFRMEAAYDQKHPTDPSTPKRTAVICAGSYLHGSRMVFGQAPFDSERQVQVYAAGTSIDTLVSELNEYQPDRLVSYSSAVDQLCEEAQQGRLHLPRLKSISINSEPLEAHTRAMTQQLWGIDIQSAWGCLEMGVTGVEGGQFEGMSLAEDYLVFEAVNAQGHVVVDDQENRGEPAHHLLVTRLFGNTMPLIRYELTDSVSISSERGHDAPNYRRVLQVCGRADVCFEYQHENENKRIKVHPIVFRSVLGQEPAIAEYQVRQTRQGAEVDLLEVNSEKEPVDTRRIAQDLILHLQRAGVADPQMHVQVVDQLRRHPESNKLTRFVQLKKLHNAAQLDAAK